jgi:D-xylose 1-dehydrogenase (NADP+, D-xylono-1,5-lactone-forming)
VSRDDTRDRLGRDDPPHRIRQRAVPVELERDVSTRRLSVDPADPYRIEFEAASQAIRNGTRPEFGRADAIDQAATIEAVRTAAEAGTTVTLAPPVAC